MALVTSLETHAAPTFRSYTQLSTYEECPESYRLKYVERIPETPAIWSVGGTAFHTVAEWYMGGDISNNPSVLKNAWDTAWQLAYDEVAAKHPEPLSEWRAANKGKENFEWWKINGFQMVLDFAEWKESQGATLVTFSDDEHKYLEHRLEVTLGGVAVVVIPDALVVDEHGQLNILDYKTGRRAPDSYTQLGVYRAGVLAGLGLDTTWGLFYMARETVVLPVDLRRYDPDQIGLRFAYLDTAIKLEQFDPTPGPACKFCPFKKTLCRYYNPEVTT